MSHVVCAWGAEELDIVIMKPLMIKPWLNKFWGTLALIIMKYPTTIVIQEGKEAGGSTLDFSIPENTWHLHWEGTQLIENIAFNGPFRGGHISLLYLLVKDNGLYLSIFIQFIHFLQTNIFVEVELLTGHTIHHRPFSQLETKKWLCLCLFTYKFHQSNQMTECDFIRIWFQQG